MFAVTKKEEGITMNTKISYLYRDAGNYKRYNECIRHVRFGAAVLVTEVRHA